MTPTDVIIPSEVFIFTGQSTIDTWALKNKFSDMGWSAYDQWMADELIFSMQKIMELADSFPFWQRIKNTGRKPVKERDLLIAFLLRQFFDTTFRHLVGYMSMLNEYFQFEMIPHHSVISRYNRSKRWNHIWKRFHNFVMKTLPARDVNSISDGTGYGGRKEHWRDVDYGIRCIQNWVKTHVNVDEDSFLIMSYSLTKSNVHESVEFKKNWKNLPENVTPKRSLADSAYTSNEILELVRSSSAIPYHGVKKNAACKKYPETAYDKLVYFFKHFPDRFNDGYCMRGLVETVFSMIDSRFGYRIRCRSDIGRENEVHAKISSHNIRMICAKIFFSTMV